MCLVSYNVRGFEGRPKQIALKMLLDELHPDMVFLQETLCSHDQAMIAFSHLPPGCECCACDATGLSGGLLTAWKPLVVRCKAFSYLCWNFGQGSIQRFT